MSQQNSSHHLLKKNPSKSSSVSSHNSSHKLKKLSSASIHTLHNVDEAIGTNAYDPPNLENRKRIDKAISNANFAGRKLWTNPLKIPERPTSSSFVTNTIEEESELIGLLTKQLYAVESQLQKMQSTTSKAEERLQIKEQEIIRLKKKVKEWELKSKNQEILRKKEQQQRRNQIENSEYLYKRCLNLEHKIYEMEKFLADYGLIWVGDSNDNSQSGKNNNYIESCYEQLVANIDQLNLAAGKDEVHIQRNEKGSGASFKFYKNGMIVQNGPLRSYNESSTRSFIRDILDGYFPSELQSAHPNGVPFKIEDHRKEAYIGDGADFPGPGYRLGKQLIENKLSSGVEESGVSCAKAERSSLILRPNFYSAEASSTPLQFSARSLKSKSSTETPRLDIVSLRSQILASHNNVCSDVHLQSHINAELALSSRKEKRDSATKSTEYDLLLGECCLKTKGIAKLTSNSRRSYHSSIDRSSSKSSPRRPDLEKERIRHRSRSASLSSGRFTVNSISKASVVPSSNLSTMKNSNYSLISDTVKHPRTSKSMTLPRKGAPPLLHQINDPTGDSSELRLKVRSLNGGTVYLVHVSADEMVSKLYRLLDKAMPRPIAKGYKIVINGYSPKRLDQPDITLRQSGITTDSVLHLVND